MYLHNKKSKLDRHIQNKEYKSGFLPNHLIKSQKKKFHIITIYSRWFKALKDKYYEFETMIIIIKALYYMC